MQQFFELFLIFGILNKIYNKPVEKGAILPNILCFNISKLNNSISFVIFSAA